MSATGISDLALPYPQWVPIHIAWLLCLSSIFKKCGLGLPASLVVAYYLLCYLTELTVHTTLAEYADADLWLAAATLMSVAASELLPATGGVNYVTLSLVVALACSHINLPGSINVGAITGVIVLLMLLAFAFTLRNFHVHSFTETNSELLCLIPVNVQILARSAVRQSWAPRPTSP